MPEHAIGSLFAVATAVLWASSATCFEGAGRRVGSLAVNVLRMAIALLLLAALCQLRRGSAWPTDAGGHTWAWIAVSGSLGFFLCDLCLFKAYVLIGARRSTLILALAPVFATLLDAFVLLEPPTLRQAIGIIVTLAGVVWVIAERPDAEAAHSRKERRTGIALAFVAAVMQPLGATAAAKGMKLPDGSQYDPMAATFIRVLTGFVLFALFALVVGRGKRIVLATKNRRAMSLLTLGAVCGPVLGVTCFLASLQHVPTGVTQAILATIPVLLLPVAILQKHERVTWRAAVGACVAVGGVIVLCLA